MKLSEKIAKNLVEGTFLKVSFRKMRLLLSESRTVLDRFLCAISRWFLSRCSRVSQNKVLFMTYNNEFMCNPKYICQEILRQELPLELVWATSAKQIKAGQFPEGVRPVIRGSYAFFREAATARVWVDNAVCFPWNPIPKKKGQFYLQTWHGSMGLKRIGSGEVKDRRWIFAAKLAGKWTDVCISNSTFETEVYRQTHWPATPIAELGHARNDILFSSGPEREAIAARVRAHFGIPEEKRIALYAPTFRNANATKAYSLDYARVLTTLEDAFGGEWVLLNRFHFKTKKAPVPKPRDKRIYAASGYPDIQELLVAADVGITDYSSWICDYVLTGKPGFLFVPDLHSYHRERGFYYPLEETPFPIAMDNDGMEENIRNFNPEDYSRRREAFLLARGCKEDGRAAQRAARLIKQQCGL